MRLKEESNNWRASAIQKRDFRHTHDGPEVDTHKVKGRKPHPKKNHHKHVWVEVDFQEYARYARGWSRWMFYEFKDNPPYWAEYSTYFVCADCLDTKRKFDLSRYRAYYHRTYGRSW